MGIFSRKYKPNEKLEKIKKEESEEIKRLEQIRKERLERVRKERLEQVRRERLEQIKKPKILHAMGIVDTSDKEIKNTARWVDSPSDNSTKESRIQQKYDSEKTTNYEFKEKEFDDYVKLQEKQRRQKEIRDEEIKEKENYVYKKFQEEQMNNPHNTGTQNSKDDPIVDVLKNLANEIFKENQQNTREYSYTSKQESNQEYSSTPKPIQQKTIEYSNIPDFSSDDPYCILGVFPDMSLSEINQRRRELLTRYYSSRDMVNRSEKEQKELERIQGKILNAWRLINNKT